MVTIMKKEVLVLVIFIAITGMTRTLEPKLKFFFEDNISDETRRSLRETLLCKSDIQTTRVAVATAGRLQDSTSVPFLNILRDISNKQPVILYHHTNSSSTNGDNQPSRRPIGRTTMFVLFVNGNSDKEFSETLRILKQSEHWNARAQFILLLFQTYKNLEEKIGLIFRICWHNQMLNVALINMETKFKLITVADLNVYSYNPFNQHSNTTNIIGVSFESFKNLMCRSDRQHFYLNNLPLRDMKGYPLRVSMFDHRPKSILKVGEDEKIYSIGGEDGILLKVLAKHMNITPIIQTPKDKVDMSFRRSDGIVTGSTGDIIYDRADVSFNSRFLRFDYINDVDFTYPHDKEGFCIIVPKAERIPEYLCIFLPFRPVIWLACGVSIIVTATLWYLTELRRKGRSSYIHVILNAYAVFLATSLRSNTSHNYGRIIFITWAFSSMILISTYQSSLITYLMSPQFYDDIDTLQEFDKSGLKLVMFPGMKESAVVDNLDPLRVSLDKKTILTTQNFSSCIHDVIRHKDRGCAYNKLSADWTVRQAEYFSNGELQLHVVRECLSWYAEAYEVHRDSPFLPYFNAIIIRISESGLIRKWRRDVQFKVISKQRRIYATSKQKTVLQLKHFEAAFFSLIIGLFISMLVFLWEIKLSVFPHRQRKRCK